MGTLLWTSCTKRASSVPEFFSRFSACAKAPASLTPASSPRLLVSVWVLYLFSVALLHAYYGGQRGSARGPPRFASKRWFTGVATAHNLLLCLGSLAMNLGITSAIVGVVKRPELGLRATVCTPAVGRFPQLPGELQYWLYIFYLSKFYELLDTVLLILRGRPLTLLHVWHHASVLAEVWGWQEYGVTVAVYGMWFNTFVHVIMYAYYAASLLKIPFPLKRAITSVQIIQFITGFCSLMPFAHYHFQGAGCTGVPGLALAAVINGSYLALFVQFFNRTYLGKRRKQSIAARSGVIAPPTGKED